MSSKRHVLTAALLIATPVLLHAASQDDPSIAKAPMKATAADARHNNTLIRATGSFSSSALGATTRLRDSPRASPAPSFVTCAFALHSVSRRKKSCFDSLIHNGYCCTDALRSAGPTCQRNNKAAEAAKTAIPASTCE